MAITKKVGWNAATRTATVLLVATALPGGSVEAGQYTHEDPTDELSFSQYSHVTFQHVRDILYRFAGWQDMQIVTLVDNTIVKATALAVSPTSVLMSAGVFQQLVPTVTPAGTDDKRVTYTTDNSEVAKVDKNGKLYATGVGTTMVHVRTADGSEILKSVPVTVYATYVALTGITITPATVELSLAGTTTQQLGITPAPLNASNVGIATWVSSDPTKATVSATGLVTALAAGTTTITATSVDGAKTDTQLVTVTA